MRRLRSLLLAVGLFVLLTCPGLARAEEEEPKPEPKPFLWVVEGEPTIYLFGTIHVPDERVLDLPDVVKSALEASDVFWAELPMEPETRMAMQVRAMLPPGQTLESLLPADVYERLGTVLASKGYQVAMFGQAKVWTLAMMLQVLDILPQLATKKALDDALYEQSKTAGKEVGGLETADEQIDIFDKLTKEEQVELLKATLDLMEKHQDGDESLIDRFIRLYLEGDAQQLLEAMYESYDPEDELQKKLMEKLIDDRNTRMVERIVARTKAAPEKTYFVAIGTAHYPGEKGILKLLEANGWKVRRMKATDEIPAKEPAVK